MASLVTFYHTKSNLYNLYLTNFVYYSFIVNVSFTSRIYQPCLLLIHVLQANIPKQRECNCYWKWLILIVYWGNDFTHPGKEKAIKPLTYEKNITYFLQGKENFMQKLIFKNVLGLKVLFPMYYIFLSSRHVI